MSYLMLPPEITSAQMFSGPGSGPMLAAAASWGGLGNELGAAAESFSSVTSGLADGPWQGAAAAAMAAVAAQYGQWLSTAAAHAENAATQATAVAGMFEAAKSAIAHPAAVTANRMQLVSLVRSNLFGFNAPAIAATEAAYESMWAQNVSTLTGYHGGASAAAAQLTSSDQALKRLPASLGAASAAARAVSVSRTLLTKSDAAALAEKQTARVVGEASGRVARIRKVGGDGSRVARVRKVAVDIRKVAVDGAASGSMAPVRKVAKYGDILSGAGLHQQAIDYNLPSKTSPTPEMINAGTDLQVSARTAALAP